MLGVVGARSTMRSRSTLLCVGLVIDGFVFVIAYLTFPASASLHATGDALGMIEPRQVTVDIVQLRDDDRVGS